jgi:hypothetical protein
MCKRRYISKVQNDGVLSALPLMHMMKWTLAVSGVCKLASGWRWVGGFIIGLRYRWGSFPVLVECKFGSTLESGLWIAAVWSRPWFIKQWYPNLIVSWHAALIKNSRHKKDNNLKTK